MKLGRLARGLGAASLAALVSVPLVAAPASAAPAAPAAYAALVRAYPLYWAGSGSLPVVDMRVPYVSASTSNVPVVRSQSALAQPDLNVTAMRGDSITGLACTGFDERKCTDPFVPEADIRHNVADPVHTEMVASFTGREGRFPGRVRALADCGGDCGHQLVRTAGDAAAPAGSATGYISVGSSVASQDISLDDRGRLVGVARSELRDVVIGPKGEVRFSSLVTTANASGAGSENSKAGRSDVKVTDFVILDNPVELTRAGLRLANGAPSEQEAYDGGKALLQQLADRGITLGLPNFDTQVVQKPDHVTVQAQGLRVRFDRSVQGPPGVTAETVDQIIDLGSSTAVVAAFDTERNVNVAFEGDQPTVTAEPPASAPAGGGPAPAPSPAVTPPTGTQGGGRSATSRGPLPVTKPTVRSSPPATAAPVATPPAPAPGTEILDPAGSVEPQPAPDTTPNTEEGAIGVGELTDNLGLRGAQSVSRAFGAFLGLALILPVARFVIRRFG